MFTIENRGAEIASTDYWDSEHASAGLCYLSANAGTLRLLVPEAAEGMLPEMRTGKRVTIEPSISDPRCVDIVFEDGTSSPFSLALDKRQIDRVLSRGNGIPLTVWTQRGKVLSFTSTIAT